MNENRPSGGSTRAHVAWTIGVLVVAIAILISVQWSRYPNFIDRMTFAATIVSILLAVLAIIYAFYSNDSIANSVGKLTSSADTLAQNTEKFYAALKALEEKVGVIPESLIAVTRGIEALSNQRQGNANQHFQPPANQPADEFARRVVDRFLLISSWNGLKALRICRLAAHSNQPVDVGAVCDRDGYMSFDYAFAYIVATSCFGIFEHAFVNRTLTVNAFMPYAAEKLDGVMEGFIANRPENERPLLREQIQKIDSIIPNAPASAPNSQSGGSVRK